MPFPSKLSTTRTLYGLVTSRPCDRIESALPSPSTGEGRGGGACISHARGRTSE
jgi:hypothetical protein